MHVACRMNLVLPDKCAVQCIADKQYNKYKALLSGITPKNQAQIGKELKELGVVSDAAVQRDESVGESVPWILKGWITMYCSTQNG